MTEKNAAISVLFVCMGNICRSPIAEGVFKEMIEEKGLSNCIYSDSAGTHGYHVGDRPDPRAIRVAADYGYDISNLRARQVEKEDFDRFDYIFFMDKNNESMLHTMAPTGRADKLHYLMDFAGFGKMAVKDPYYGDRHDFEVTVELIEKACPIIINKFAQMLAKA